jgi:hypothetical protein
MEHHFFFSCMNSSLTIRLAEPILHSQGALRQYSIGRSTPAPRRHCK